MAGADVLLKDVPLKNNNKIQNLMGSNLNLTDSCKHFQNAQVHIMMMINRVSNSPLQFSLRPILFTYISYNLLIRA
jgi:hypothetical protein